LTTRGRATEDQSTNGRRRTMRRSSRVESGRCINISTLKRRLSANQPPSDGISEYFGARPDDDGDSSAGRRPIRADGASTLGSAGLTADEEAERLAAINNKRYIVCSMLPVRTYAKNRASSRQVCGQRTSYTSYESTTNMERVQPSHEVAPGISRRPSPMLTRRPLVQGRFVGFNCLDCFNSFLIFLADRDSRLSRISQLIVSCRRSPPDGASRSSTRRHLADRQAVRLVWNLLNGGRTSVSDGSCRAVLRQLSVVEFTTSALSPYICRTGAIEDSRRT